MLCDVEHGASGANRAVAAVCIVRNRERESDSGGKRNIIPRVLLARPTHLHYVLSTEGLVYQVEYCMDVFHDNPHRIFSLQ